MMIITSKCADCNFSEIDYSNKRKVTVKCNMRQKTYFWGQCIECEQFVKKPEFKIEHNNKNPWGYKKK